MELAKFAIVGFYLGLNTLLLVYLAFKVIGQRRSGQVSLGDGGNAYLGRLIRGHGNAAETIPVFFLMLIIAAAINTPALALHALGLLFTIGRFTHALFFIREKSSFKPRFYGMLMTLTAIILLALGLVAHSAFIVSAGY